MPYRSKKQRAWMHINEPEIAARWDKDYGGKVVPKKRKPRRRNRTKRTTKRSK